MTHKATIKAAWEHVDKAAQLLRGSFLDAASVQAVKAARAKAELAAAFALLDEIA